MTVTTNEFGQQNLFAKEPQMYVSKTDAEKIMDMRRMQSVRRN